LPNNLQNIFYQIKKKWINITQSNISIILVIKGIQKHLKKLKNNLDTPTDQKVTGLNPVGVTQKISHLQMKKVSGFLFGAHKKLEKCF